MKDIYGRYLNPTKKRIEELENLRARLRRKCFEYEGESEKKYFRIMERSNERLKNEWEGRRLQQQHRFLNSCGY